MTPDEFADARSALAERWGLDSPLTPDEMGRCLKLRGRDPGQSVLDYERGKTGITGPIEVAIAGLMAMDEPPEWADLFED